MEVKAGEIYGKRSGNGVAMYAVLKVARATITLQNIHNPLSLFETTSEKLQRSGYERVSQTPYIAAGKPSKRRAHSKPKRCPYTMDFIEGRADCEKPVFAG